MLDTSLQTHRQTETKYVNAKKASHIHFMMLL